MLKTFSGTEELGKGNKSQLKNSACRALRKTISDIYPTLEEDDIEFLLPKKNRTLYQCKCKNNVLLFLYKDGNEDGDEDCGGGGGGSGGGSSASASGGANSNESLPEGQRVLFWQHFKSPLLPTLPILHLYPSMLPKVQVDKGAIKFILSGADVMAPGVLSKGGNLPLSLKEDDYVAIIVEGMEHAIGIGRMIKGSDEILKERSGSVIQSLHVLNDGLWRMVRGFPPTK